ncbi:MAG: hypothetical protein RSA29_18160 [Clostridium sp.]|uniref:hypothetical protein n=1 Tax=Clostridium sp. TaxID=1506 RepID=UPI002FC72BB5
MRNNRETSCFDNCECKEDICNEYRRDCRSYKPTNCGCYETECNEEYRPVKCCYYEKCKPVDCCCNERKCCEEKDELERELKALIEARSNKKNNCGCRRDDDGLWIIIALFFFCGGWCLF